MLLQLHLHNFALAEQLQVDLQPGLTVVTGETGAGKSIVLQALAICLGDRADSSSVRIGADKADVSALFDIGASPAAATWLAERDLPCAQNQVLLRRVVGSEGRSKAWINGVPSNVSDLKQLADLLVHVHSQHSHHLLLNPSYAITWLDTVLGLQGQVAQLADAFAHWHSAQQRYKLAVKQSESNVQKQHLLEGYITEYQALSGSDYAQINQQYDELSRFESTLQTAQQLLQALDDDEAGLANNLRSVLRLCLTGKAEVFSQLQPHLYSAEAELSEALQHLRRYVDNAEFDPVEFARLDATLAEFHRLARKHRVEPSELNAMHQSWQTEQAELQQAADLQALADSVAQTEAAYNTADQTLNQARAAGMAGVLAQLTAQVQALAMEQAQFAFSPSPIAPSPLGNTDYQLLFTANKGMPLQVLSKTASGGELSRIMLVMQLLSAHTQQAATLVFDEVDVGISGATAQVVGRMLRDLSKHTQILSITHQPQVAAMGHQHLHVHKVQTDPAQSNIVQLNDQERVLEIARISGGVALSDAVLAHARELLAHAQQGGA